MSSGLYGHFATKSFTASLPSPSTKETPTGWPRGSALSPSVLLPVLLQADPTLLFLIPGAYSSLIGGYKPSEHPFPFVTSLGPLGPACPRVLWHLSRVLQTHSFSQDPVPRLLPQTPPTHPSRLSSEAPFSKEPPKFSGSVSRKESALPHSPSSACTLTATTPCVSVCVPMASPSPPRLWVGEKGRGSDAWCL